MFVFCRSRRLILWALVCLIGCGDKSPIHQDAPEAHEDENETVGLSSERLAALGLTLAPVETGSLLNQVTVPAVLQFDTSRVVHISPKVTGSVVSVAVKVGDTVSAGQALLVLESREYGLAFSEYLQAQSQLRLEAADFERAKQLVAQGLLAAQDFQQAQAHHENAEIELAQKTQSLLSLGLAPEAAAASGARGLSTLRAPTSGVVTSVHAGQGETLDAEDEVITLVDPSVIWAVGQVPESLTSGLAVGRSVQVCVDAAPKPLTAVIDFVGLGLDPQTRRLEVRVSLDNRDLGLKAGLLARLVIEQAQVDPAQVGMLVPLDALQAEGGTQLVYRQHEPGSFEAVPVAVLAKDDTRAMVRGLLEPGQLLARGDTFLLKSEINLGSSAEGHHH